MVNIVVLITLGFLSGYIIGRTYGKKEGFQNGMAYAPLSIRIESLEKGHCMICDSLSDCYKSTSMIE